MPFDVATFQSFRERAKMVNTPRERLLLLAEALESEEAFEQLNFRWEFGSILDYAEGEDRGQSITYQQIPKLEGCGTAGCAIGMGAMIWIDEARQWIATDRTELGMYLGITADDVSEVFFRSRVYGCGFSLVTPSMVAQRLRILAGE